MKIAGLVALLISFLFAVSEAAFGQSFLIQQLDNRAGLSNSAVNSLYRDRDNLLWIATWDGLNLYDGTGFYVFNYNKENNVTSIGNNVVQRIVQDKNGFIWLSTIEGLSKYDKNKGIFKNFFYTRPQHTGISESEYDLITDSSHNVYCFTRQDGLLQYDAPKDTFTVCNLRLENKKITKVLFDANDRLWMLKQDGTLEVFERRKDGFVLLHEFNGINSFFVNDKRLLCVTASNDLFVIDASMKMNFTAKLPYPVKAVCNYKNYFLFAWSSHGFEAYDSNFRPVSFLQKEKSDLKNVKITSWETGPEDILWCGTDGNGIIQIFLEQKIFNSVNTADNAQVINKPVRAFCENNNTLWVGTKGSGIISIPGFNGITSMQNAVVEKPFKEDSENNNVFALHKGKDNLIYIGSDAKGISVYDPILKKLFVWSNLHGSDTLPAFASVYAILQDNDGSVWLGTSGYGLIHLALQKQNNEISIKLFEQYTFDGSPKGPANDIIYALEQGRDDKLWIGCRYGGLNLFDKKKKTFRVFKAFLYEGSLSHNDVLALHKDISNRLWIGTSYGLNWIDEAKTETAQPIFNKITSTEGLPNNTIHAITEDNNGNIWASTNKGLVKINPTTLSISQFQQKDGLQSNEFCDGAGWKNASDVLFFGGIFGFNYVEPAHIQTNKYFPNLLVIGLQPGSKTPENIKGIYVLHPGKLSDLKFILNRRENFFELELRAVSFINAEKNEYAYFLEGYDKNWHYSGSDGKIAYGNIPPGKYKFKVKWSNGFGIWTDETVLFPVTVKQYFWLTLPAFILYVVLLCSGFIIFGLYRRSRYKMKMQLQMEHTLRTREEEIHNEKLSFFTNITHELQTPLTLIVGASEQNLQQKDNPYFKTLIHGQASRLTYLVQQIMEFRKGEEGFLKNKFTYLNISGFTQNLSALFNALAKQKMMRYNRFIDENIEGWMDKDKLEKIMFNLLSNAFKHSPREEEVTFTLRQNVQTRHLEITVTNSGCHIPEEQQDKIFHRFFAFETDSSEKFSSGIGLAFTRQLIELLYGTVKVSSSDNVVAFHLTLPLPENVDEAQIVSPDSSAGLMPSYLLRSIVAADEEGAGAVANNKMAKLESIDNANKPIILVVDDGAAIRVLIKEVLGDQYIVYEAETGQEALELMLRTVPDCIICDVMMPGMSGLELCRKIKEAPATCHIPFILLSARGNMEQKTEGYEAGADAYIAKPFYAEHLLVRIRKLLEYKKRIREMLKKENIYNEIDEEDIADTDKVFLKSLVRYIEEHLDDENLGPEQLEKHIGMSKMNFYRKLKALSNMTPSEFIRHIRLKEAAVLLTGTQLTVSEIFYKTGFNNQSYFFREFKKLYNCSPNEYRTGKQPKMGDDLLAL